LLSLSAFGGELNSDVLEGKVLLPLRTRFSCTATEEADMLRWLVDDMLESDPWKSELVAVRDFKVLGAADSDKDVPGDKKASEEDLKASRENGAEDDNPVVTEPEEVSSVASSHKKNSVKKKNVLVVLMRALRVSDGDGDGDEEPISEIKASRLRKVLIKLKVLEFWSSFGEDMLDWDIDLENVLAR
jgi:hypothetical protein